MCLALAYAEMRVGCCQKQDLRDGEDFRDGLVCGWRLLSESGFVGWGDFRDGMLANLVLFGEDIQSVDPTEMHKLRPVVTILGGKTVMT